MTTANAQIDALIAERNRLARLLAVERGDESFVPEGWGPRGFAHAWQRRSDDSLLVVDRSSGLTWSWTARTPVGTISGHADTALEAMEAADAALAASSKRAA